ncbi:MAG: UbiA family prenyltransferase [Candidatus Paceibacterota bacterium]
MLRPKQFIKNLLIFYPPFFLVDGFRENIIPATYVFLLFCVLTAGVYLFNDSVDYANDINHPEKRKRAVARGIITPKVAYINSAILVSFSLSLSFIVSGVSVFKWFCCYLFINMFYSFYLKNVPYIELVCVATGFPLRLLVGNSISPGSGSDVVFALLNVFVLCLALTLVVSKRLNELVLYGRSVRPVLAYYTRDSLVRVYYLVFVFFIISSAPWLLLNGGFYGIVLFWSSLLILHRVLYLGVRLRLGNPDAVLRDMFFNILGFLFFISLLPLNYIS